MRVEAVSVVGQVPQNVAETVAPTAACTGCGAVSGRVHSRYVRHLSDTASSGRAVLIRLRVRRLFCDDSACVKTTFAEQLPEPAGRHARRTTLANHGNRARTTIRPALTAYGPGSACHILDVPLEYAGGEAAAGEGSWAVSPSATVESRGEHSQPHCQPSLGRPPCHCRPVESLRAPTDTLPTEVSG
ncbi:transposase family protein [Prauserella shujinwangii]|uniref:transposase family protein n=1 Tax=Prauserella shujinwangii TaxID=1453103 RepID=UPI003CCBBAA9